MDVKTFRSNLFGMNTRRFGTVAEIIVKKLISGSSATNIHHDLRDFENLRLEVKFSRVEKKHKSPIKEKGILEMIADEGIPVRIFPYGEYRQHKFKCNIQQIKPKEFEVLFYGLMFSDRVLLFFITPEQLKDPNIKYSDKQHKGNVGEGQFHITHLNLAHHIEKYLLMEISYQDIIKLLREGDSI